MAIKTAADINSTNPLHQFRTYSYHHVLLACTNSTNVQASFASIPFDQLLPSTQAIGNIAERATPKYVNNDVQNPYVVLINTQVDSEFLIKSFNFKVLPQVPPREPDSQEQHFKFAASAFMSDGTMVIEEPFGIRFGDLISQTARNLFCAPERLVFVIKTAFFGFNDQGISVVQNIKPFSICIWEIQATFTAAGGRYEIQFMPYDNGLGHRKGISMAGSAIKFQCGPTLAESMAKMEQVLNKDQEKLQENDKTLQKINYSIILDDPYPTYTFNQSVGSTNKNKNQPQVVGSLNDSITEVIQKIMMLSPQVQEELTRPAQTPEQSESNPRTDRFIFKIWSQIKNTPDNFQVIYRVQRQKIILMPIPTEQDKKENPTGLIQKQKDATAKFIADAQAAGCYLEYDYIYSGKNVDILDFEMRINLFTTYATYYAERMRIDGKGQIKNKTEAGMVTSGNSDIMSTSTPNKSKGLQFSPKPPPNTNMAIVDYKEFQKFNDYLMRSVSLATGAAYINMTIAGDPRLYAGYLQAPFDENGVTIPVDTLAAKSDMVMASWSRLPSLIKVNIFMPNPPTATLQDQTVQAAFAAPFYHDGLYWIAGIDNMFTDDGKFTQHLELLAIPADFNIADINRFTNSTSTSATTATVTDATAATTPTAVKKNQMVDLTAALTEDQKRCLAHARQAAINNNMPIETLQAILLADSGACTASRMDSKLNKTASIIHGATTLTVGRVQNYLAKDPSPLIAMSKKNGVNYTNSPDSISLLLFSNDEFNLDLCAKIWLQDRAQVQSIFNTSGNSNLINPNLRNFTDQATIAHHTMAINSDAKTKFDDVNFSIAVDAPDPTQNGYIKLIKAQQDLITQYNAVAFPQISRPNA